MYGSESIFFKFVKTDRFDLISRFVDIVEASELPLPATEPESVQITRCIFFKALNIEGTAKTFSLKINSGDDCFWVTLNIFH